MNKSGHSHYKQALGSERPGASAPGVAKIKGGQSHDVFRIYRIKR